MSFGRAGSPRPGSTGVDCGAAGSPQPRPARGHGPPPGTITDRRPRFVTPQARAATSTTPAGSQATRHSTPPGALPRRLAPAGRLPILGRLWAPGAFLRVPQERAAKHQPATTAGASQAANGVAVRRPRCCDAGASRPGAGQAILADTALHGPGAARFRCKCRPEPR